MSEWKIDIDNLTLGYDRHPVVHHVSLSLNQGEMIAIVGPNGAGKSTLLKALTGELVPLSGSVTFDGIKRDQLAYLTQISSVDRQFPVSAYDFVATGLWGKKGAFARFSKKDHCRVECALDEVGMLGSAKAPISKLSGGQFQRLRFARMLVQETEVFLLDEPFVGVDAHTTQDLLDVLARLNRQGKTLVCVLHDFTMVKTFFPQVWVLARELVATGDPREILSNELLVELMQVGFSLKPEAEKCLVDEGAPNV